MSRLSTTRRRARRALGAARRRAGARALDLRDAAAARAASRSLGRITRGSADTAVVIHLYYPEVWPSLAAHVARLHPHDVDIFVTLPKANRYLIPAIHKSFPAAHCIVTPNRGRDILPFVLVAEHLASMGYKVALKLHSKKSEHFGGGDQWRESMLDELLPDDPAVVAAILEVLHDDRTGMIGPRSTYFALSTYWAGNADTVKRLLPSTVSVEALNRLERPNELGFFAGAMFWVRLDAIAPLLPQNPLEFVREPTRKDGTLAHALERAISVLPELLGRHQFDTDGCAIAARPPAADPLPEWYRAATKAARPSTEPS